MHGERRRAVLGDQGRRRVDESLPAGGRALGGRDAAVGAAGGAHARSLADIVARWWGRVRCCIWWAALPDNIWWMALPDRRRMDERLLRDRLGRRAGAVDPGGRPDLRPARAGDRRAARPALRRHRAAHHPPDLAVHPAGADGAAVRGGVPRLAGRGRPRPVLRRQEARHRARHDAGRRRAGAPHRHAVRRRGPRPDVVDRSVRPRLGGGGPRRPGPAAERRRAGRVCSRTSCAGRSLFGMPRAGAPASYRDFRADFDGWLHSEAPFLTDEARLVGRHIAGTSGYALPFRAIRLAAAGDDRPGQPRPGRPRAPRHRVGQPSGGGVAGAQPSEPSLPSGSRCCGAHR
ncbi:hypothetical protein [Nocardioides convexus]|uniref:hypothetical protein n=1 Tax=Nocardioides convexus TaxID=2712224 RepID=UPI0024184D51|nr:hypothetical protein [Nocardioides convexus]